MRKFLCRFGPSLGGGFVRAASRSACRSVREDPRSRNKQHQQETGCKRANRADPGSAAESVFAADDSRVPQAIFPEFRACLFVEPELLTRQGAQRLAKKGCFLHLMSKIIRPRELVFELLPLRCWEFTQGILGDVGMFAFHGMTAVFSRFQRRRSVWIAP
jgi:hypothetical protein